MDIFMGPGIFILVVILQLLTLGIATAFMTVWMFYFIRNDAPYVPTPAKYLPMISGALKLAPGNKLYDIGSGDGRLLLYCAIHQPDTSFVGIEKNPLLYALARMHWRLNGRPSNLSYVRANMFDVDISDATHIYLYMLPKAMRALFPSDKTFWPMRVASRAFAIPGRYADQTIMLDQVPGNHNQHLLYIYDFKG